MLEPSQPQLQKPAHLQAGSSHNRSLSQLYNRSQQMHKTILHKYNSKLSNRGQLKPPAFVHHFQLGTVYEYDRVIQKYDPDHHCRHP